MVILDVEIPLSPPSVNTSWGFNKSRRYLTPLANRFVKDLANWVKPKMSGKRLKLEVVFNYPDKRVRDLDNNLKPLIDGLVKCGLCVDDEQLDELIIKRGEVVKGGLIKINSRGYEEMIALTIAIIIGINGSLAIHWGLV